MTLSAVSENSNQLVLQMSPAWEMSADSLNISGDPLLAGFVLDLERIW